MFPPPPQRVVITGVGLITPLGIDRESSWQGMKNGNRATRWLDPCDWDIQQPRQYSQTRGMAAGAPAPMLRFCDDQISMGRGSDNALGINLAACDPVIQLAVCAAYEAMEDAKLEVTHLNRNRIGCVVGTSKGGLRSFAQSFRHRLKHNVDFSAELWTQLFPNAPAAALSRLFDLRGPCLCPITACATGLASLVRGAELIRTGYCDAVVVGSTDASLQQVLLASFQRLGVLARGFDDPETACRPFDRHRNGFLVGEGAGMLIMERSDCAADRGAIPYAEWVSDGCVTDCAGLTQLEPQPHALTRLIQDVLRRAELTSDEIDYVNLHGTATIQNDICETRALNAALGRSAQHVCCSALKGGIGHLLGSAGSVELACTLLAMRDSTIPPTVNLDEQDVDCDLNFTPREPRRQRIENALKLSLGFGGHLIAAVVRKTQ